MRFDKKLGTWCFFSLVLLRSPFLHFIIVRFFISFYNLAILSTLPTAWKRRKVCRSFSSRKLFPERARKRYEIFLSILNSLFSISPPRHRRNQARIIIKIAKRNVIAVGPAHTSHWKMGIEKIHYLRIKITYQRINKFVYTRRNQTSLSYYVQSPRFALKSARVLNVSARKKLIVL